jgi:hypothetical protein
MNMNHIGEMKQRPPDVPRVFRTDYNQWFYIDSVDGRLCIRTLTPPTMAERRAHPVVRLS